MARDAVRNGKKVTFECREDKMEQHSPRIKEHAELKPHQIIQRKPCGYWCRITKIDTKKKKALIRDAHRGTSYWVSEKTLIEKWQY